MTETTSPSAAAAGGPDIGSTALPAAAPTNPAAILYGTTTPPPQANAQAPAATIGALGSASLQSAAQGDLAMFAANLYRPAPEPEPEPVPEMKFATVDELLDRELDATGQVAQAMYGDGGSRPDDPAGYASTLGAEAFDQLEREARWDHDDEAVAALDAGRREAAAVLHELAVPTAEAREVTGILAEWNATGEVADDRQLLIGRDRGMSELEAKWGQDTDAKIELAQRVAEQACKRLPWLSDLLARGAGNDARLIERFADIGERQARKSLRAKR